MVDAFKLGDIVETVKGAKFWGEIIAFDNDEALPGCTVRAIDPGFLGTKHVYPLKQLQLRALQAAQPGWLPIEEAPKDGTWFLVLKPVTIVGGGKPCRAAPGIMLLHRARTSPTSDGYWSDIWGHSVADDYIGKYSRWAPMTALPLVSIWAEIEQERLRHGGAPMPLPVPLPPVPAGEER